ncbi:MAG: ABC transporter substrate-binding protein [Acidimicrobiia bacterium]|nr:ABC transporter substrate-binding protein [Acidimicrobiia bacterium]
MLRPVLAAAALAFAAAAVVVTAGSQAVAANRTSGCLTSFDPAADYFPGKAAIEDAVNFRVEYRKSYKVVTVREAFAGGPAERYLLVQCGAPLPRGESASAIVTVPITSLFAGSTTHLAPLVDLGRVDVLSGVSRLRDLTGDEIVRRASTGHVSEFAPSSVIDAELVVSRQPSVLMSGGSPLASLSVIRAAGIPVVANTEWLESTALARAEWLKYVALFLNEEREAQTHYAALKARYRALSARARAASPKPLVMTGRSTNGTFVIAGGRSYVAALIADAGGRYVWAENASAGAPSVDLEAQVRRASAADIWINGGGWPSLAQMRQDEPRYPAFKAYRDGQVWVYERRLTPTGRNDYWMRSTSRPDLVLADLIKIFHPSLLPDHTFEWYMRVPPR